MTSTIPDEKKLTVAFNLEAGCLGPQGEDHILKFCSIAENQLKTINPSFLLLQVHPRKDKNQPEIQYLINNKNIKREQASQYFQLFKQNINTFEDMINEALIPLINDYLGY